MSLASSHEGMATASPTRPSSAWTSDSIFTDSAISMRTRSPAPHEKESNALDADEAPEQHVVAQRLDGLVSEIWACEQDRSLSLGQRRKLDTAMDQIEAALEEDTRFEDTGAEITHLSQALKTPDTTAPMVTESELEVVRNSLANTVESMRLRQQEQRHLHQLTVDKLEAVAQRCIEQERRLQEYAAEMATLKEENRTLSHEKEHLDIQVSELQINSARKEVAVTAMSSAVSGLEGWINGSPTQDQAPPRQKIVTRGRGRFRGRYYVGEPVGHPIGYGPDVASDAKGLQDGVSAWLRGFRDVEEELRSSQIAARNAHLTDAHRISRLCEDEWGDFERATAS